MTDGKHFETPIDEAGTVQIGDNNTANISSTVNIERVYNVLKQQSYRGDKARKRNALLHKLELYGQLKEDGLYDEKEQEKFEEKFFADIKKQTVELLSQEDKTLWDYARQTLRYIAYGVNAIFWVFLIFVFLLWVSVDEKISKGHTDMSTVGHWMAAAKSVFKLQKISPHGNIMPDQNQFIDVMRSGEDGRAPFSFSLVSLRAVKECAPDVADRTPHPKNGQYILLKFEVRSGEVSGPGGNVFSKTDFMAVTDEGKTDIGQTSGSDCIPGVISGGLEYMPANSRRYVEILADVPTESGHIVFTVQDGKWGRTWEWEY